MSDTSESCCNSLRILSFQLALASDPLGKGWIARLVFFSGVVSLMLGQFPQRGCAVQSIFFELLRACSGTVGASVDGVHRIQHRSSLLFPSISPKQSASLGIFLDPLLTGSPFSEC